MLDVSKRSKWYGYGKVDEIIKLMGINRRELYFLECKGLIKSKKYKGWYYVYKIDEAKVLAEKIKNGEVKL